MGDVLPFRKPKPSDKRRNKTLCKSGFHKWKIDPSQRFDVKQGKLVTVYRCVRCSAIRRELH